MHWRVLPSPCSIPMPNLARAPSSAISSVAIWPVLRKATRLGPVLRPGRPFIRSTNVPQRRRPVDRLRGARGASRSSGVVARSGAASGVERLPALGAGHAEVDRVAGVGVRPTATPSRRWMSSPQPVEQKPHTMPWCRRGGRPAAGTWPSPNPPGHAGEQELRRATAAPHRSCPGMRGPTEARKNSRRSWYSPTSDEHAGDREQRPRLAGRRLPALATASAIARTGHDADERPSATRRSSTGRAAGPRSRQRRVDQRRCAPAGPPPRRRRREPPRPPQPADGATASSAERLRRAGVGRVDQRQRRRALPPTDHGGGEADAGRAPAPPRSSGDGVELGRARHAGQTRDDGDRAGWPGCSGRRSIELHRAPCRSHRRARRTRRRRRSRGSATSGARPRTARQASSGRPRWRTDAPSATRARDQRRRSPAACRPAARPPRPVRSHAGDRRASRPPPG